MVTTETSADARVSDLSYEGFGDTPTEGISFSRKEKRITQTQEIQIRTTHRRRKLLSRGGVLVGFALAMIVYPVMGNVVSYANSAQGVPGVVLGQAPTTGEAVLGDGPRLIPTVLELPTVDEQSRLIAVNQPKYSASVYLPNCLPLQQYTGENGRLSDDQLCSLWNGKQLRADAAIAFAEMNAQFAIAYGRDLCFSGGYRTYGEQVATKRSKGYLAATPGKSMHGWGLAFDLCGSDSRGEVKAWLDANAATFGYENPQWAKTRVFEPWHWEYKPGTDALGVYGSTEYWDSGDGQQDDGTGTDTAATPAAEPGDTTTGGTTP